MSKKDRYLITRGQNNNNNDKEGSLLNKLLNNELLTAGKRSDPSLLNNKGYIIRSFSLPNNKETLILLEALKKLAKQDGWSFSNIVYQALREYVIRHCPGNPQVPIVKFLQGNETKPITICEVPGCNGKATYRIGLKNYEGQQKVFRVCERHKHAKFGEYRFLMFTSPMSKGTK